MAQRKSSSKTEKEPESFAEARNRLDAILDELEQDGGDVDRLAARIREASRLVRYCRERLTAARAEVTQVVAELGAEEQAVVAPDGGGETPAAEPEADESAPIDSGGALPF